MYWVFEYNYYEVYIPHNTFLLNFHSGKLFLCDMSNLQELVEMLHLKPAQLVLDVGGGIGGSAFYMAQVRCLSAKLETCLCFLIVYFLTLLEHFVCKEHIVVFVIF